MNSPFRVKHWLLLHQSQTNPLLQLQLTVIRFFKARQNAHERGFARAIATNQAHALKGLQGKICVIEQGGLTKRQLGLL